MGHHHPASNIKLILANELTVDTWKSVCKKFSQKERLILVGLFCCAVVISARIKRDDLELKNVATLIHFVGVLVLVLCA